MSSDDNFSETDPRLKIFATELEVFEFTANLLTEIIQSAIDSRQNCDVIVASGRSITKSLGLLSRDASEWQRVNWYLADERCVADDDVRRNDLQIRQVLKQTLGDKYGTVHSTRSDMNLEEAAKEYATRIGQINMFDFCLLGMGDDGHIASLLPGHRALDSTEKCCLVTDSPNPPNQRITLSMSSVRNAKNRIVVTTGTSKKQAVLDFRKNSKAPVRIFAPGVIALDQSAFK